MDPITLISILILVGSALLLILYPLWQQIRPEAIFKINRSGQTLEEHQARYQALLAAMRDLRSFLSMLLNSSKKLPPR